MKQQFFYVMIWNHPIETTIYKQMFQVPGIIIHRHRLLRLASSGASGVHYFFRTPQQKTKQFDNLGSTKDSDWKRKVYQKGNSPLLKKK